jgi:hypothetical protein
MPINKEDLQACLRTKFGFEPARGNPHDAMALFFNGKKVATARFSRGQREIDDTILTVMARQLFVNLGFFKGMFLCTKSIDNYIAHLRQNNKLN